MEQGAVAIRKDKTIFRDGDKLVKLFGENYSKSNILNEALNQARVEETGLPIPKIRAVEHIDGKWAIVMDYIEGETLESKMQNEPERTDEWLEIFVDTQMKIHEKRSPLLTKFKDKLTNTILSSELDASTRYDLSLRLDAMPKHTHVCHGDFNPSNVVLGADGKTYILDWSHASQGNATADAAKTYLIFRMSGQDGLAEKYAEKYAEKTGTARKYLNEWLPLVAAAQLIKTDDPKRKELLMRFVNFEE